MTDGHIEPEMLTPKQVAALINQCRTTVFKLIKTGELESVLSSPRKRLVPRDAALAYIARERQQTTTNEGAGR